MKKAATPTAKSPVSSSAYTSAYNSINNMPVSHNSYVSMTRSISPHHLGPSAIYVNNRPKLSGSAGYNEKMRSSPTSIDHTARLPPHSSKDVSSVNSSRLNSTYHNTSSKYDYNNCMTSNSKESGKPANPIGSHNQPLLSEQYETLSDDES